ncbi:PAS-domain containing protein [uncultured Cohaesibacter sp.]|uniref:hybrid sensor histidine kinase/response regulator n=1 Tax=uncultured Cohaesibacter sp. TaxID=1002546 RepID=UPI0029C8441C|nr:PAS-domain containing protein [uncultured Cohaesibacter sp.]
MEHGLINPADTLERQNEKLIKIVTTLMRRIEKGVDASGVAYAQFQRAVLLEDEVRSRTHDLERALDLLNESNVRLARANAEAETARVNLANALETVQEGFALFDAEDVLVMCNSRFGLHMRDIHPRLQPGLRFEDYVRIVSTSRYLDLPEGQASPEWAANRMERHKDRHVAFNVRMAGDCWLQVSEHRTPDGGTVILQTDITDMVLLERQERERLLDGQAQLIRATLEHLNQGICIFDDQNRLIGWNQRAGELLTIAARQFQLGISFGALYKLIRSKVSFSRKQDVKRIEDWVQVGVNRPPLSFEIVIGRDRVLAVFAQQMPDKGFVISFTDVSAERLAVRAISEVNETLEQRVAERTLELEAALAEAERANASKSRFVAAASHDLLQPLSAAKLFVASLESELADPELASPELAERAAKANNALMSAENILNALLDISKLDSGRAALHEGPVALDDLLGPLRDELRPLAEKKGLAFRMVSTGAVVISDASYLRRILQNLISNAIRYTARGKVLVGVRSRMGRLFIEVWDTGPGIPEHEQGKIFQEFQRLNATVSAADGMGLGLAIVERACRLLDHPLHLKSEVGKGTCFSVELPPSSVVPKPVPSDDLILLGKEKRLSLAHHIVLLIENDEGLRSAITLTLEKWGVDVLPCANEGEAVAVLQELDIAPDAIIADYQLDHGLLGTDVVLRLRERYGKVPTCIISANRSPLLAEQCQRLGASLHHKPLNPLELREFLEDAVSR